MKACVLYAHRLDRKRGGLSKYIENHPVMPEYKVSNALYSK